MLVFFLIYDNDNQRLVNVHKLTYKGIKSSIMRIIHSECWYENVSVEIRFYDCDRLIFIKDRRNYKEIIDIIEHHFEMFGYKEFYKCFNRVGG